MNAAPLSARGLELKHLKTHFKSTRNLYIDCSYAMWTAVLYLSGLNKVPGSSRATRVARRIPVLLNYMFKTHQQFVFPEMVSNVMPFFTRFEKKLIYSPVNIFCIKNGHTVHPTAPWLGCEA